MTTTEETTMDELDVEQVARAIWEAHNADQGITHGEAAEWGPEARAAMAARDEQIRALLVGGLAQSFAAMWAVRRNDYVSADGYWHAVAETLWPCLFGPAPRVGPASPLATREKSDAMAMHYTESMHVDRVAPICGAPISPSSVTSSSAAVTCVECLRMRPLSVSPPFVEPAPPPASDTLEAAVERARKVYALECTQLQADVRKAEAEVERLRVTNGNLARTAADALRRPIPSETRGRADMAEEEEAAARMVEEKAATAAAQDNLRASPVPPGPCGERVDSVSGPLFCHLLHGHAGWHVDDCGASWGPSTATRIVDAAIASQPDHYAGDRAAIAAAREEIAKCDALIAELDADAQAPDVCPVDDLMVARMASGRVVGHDGHDAFRIHSRAIAWLIRREQARVAARKGG